MGVLATIFAYFSNVLVSGLIYSPRYPSVSIVDTMSTLDINRSCGLEVKYKLHTNNQA